MKKEKTNKTRTFDKWFAVTSLCAHIVYFTLTHKKIGNIFRAKFVLFEWVIIKLFSFMCPTSFICYTISIVLPLSLVNVSIAFVLLYFFLLFSSLFVNCSCLDPFHPFLRNYCYLARIISLFSVRFYDSIFVFFSFFQLLCQLLLLCGLALVYVSIFFCLFRI